MDCTRVAAPAAGEPRNGINQQAAYQFWLDDLCDVYLELIKPVIKDESEENKDSRWAAQATLWINLEAGLRLLHPMMPFVTEELWQRLPGRGTLGETETETIMLAKYPECNKDYIDEASEESMDVTMKVIKGCRSLRASYKIVNKTLTHFFVNITGDSNIAAVQAQTSDIVTLGRASKVDINPPADSVPETVGTVIVDESLTLLMDLKGMVDFKVEIKRLQKDLTGAKKPLENLERKMAADGYEQKVPEDLKQANIEKLESQKKVVADIEEAIANFERLLSLEEKS